MTDDTGNTWTQLWTKSISDADFEYSTLSAYYVVMTAPVANGDTFQIDIPVNCVSGSRPQTAAGWANGVLGTVSVVDAQGFTGVGAPMTAGTPVTGPFTIAFGFGVALSEGAGGPGFSAIPAGATLLMTPEPFLKTCYQVGGTSFNNTWTLNNPTDPSAATWIGGYAIFSYGGGGADFGPKSDDLRASTYGFSIPNNSQILGIEAQITGLQTVVSATTSITAELTVAGGTVRTFNLTTGSSTVSFGGATDMWGLTLTPAQVNASGFGLVIQVFDSLTSETVEFEISAAQLTIWYAPTGTLTVKPLNAVVGATSHTFGLGSSNTTVMYGGSSDLWGMPWGSPITVNADAFGFGIFAPSGQTADFDVSEVQVRVWYQTAGPITATYGSFYFVTLYDQNGARLGKQKMWQFTEAAGATVDIATIPPFSGNGCIV